MQYRIFALLFAFINFCYAEPTIQQTWKGTIAISGIELPIVVHFSANDKGIIDIPQKQVKGLNLVKVEYKHPQIHFELPNRAIIFDGELKDNAISGTCLASGQMGTFSIKPGAIEKPKAPQKVPYHEYQISFYNGQIKLTGTLTVPTAPAQYPVVVMASGSGAQDRDSNIFGFKIFAIIADHLTRQGIAVLRFDDRGVGGSDGNISLSTTEEFANDVLAAMKFLKTRKDINPKKMGIIGHSEGGLVAIIAAAKSQDVAFAVLLAGSTVSGETLMLEQAQLILKAKGATQEMLEQQKQLQKLIFAALRSGNWEKVQSVMYERTLAALKQLPIDQQQRIGDLQKYAEKAVIKQITALGNRWLRYFVDYDPKKDMQKITCPVLAIFAELDLQVPPELNSKALVAAMKKGGNSNYQIRVIPQANHLFQKTTTGLIEEYPHLPKEFVNGFFDILLPWVKEQAK